VTLATLEELLTEPMYFGLVEATPVQRAVCRILDGFPLGELWDYPEVKRALGDVRPPLMKPRELCLLAGIRGGKSLISAACAIRASQSVDVSKLGPGEVPRIPLLATDKDAATIVLHHLQGNLLGRPALARLLVEEPTADMVRIKHPTGRCIEVKVTALSRAGSTLVGRWLAGCVFDEAPRMQGEEDGVLNLDHARQAILGRMLPGAQILYIGSPWAPLGPVYEIVQEHFGKPTESIVVIRARGPDMNPSYWTPERQRDLEKRKPATYRTDVLAEFADPEQAMFDSRSVEACTRTDPLVREAEKGTTYVAAMDPATRGNAWTLTIVGCGGRGGPGGVRPLYTVALARQWVGSAIQPLRAHEVLKEIADACKPYAVDTVRTDQYSFDALREIADSLGMSLIEEKISSERRLELIDRLALEISDGCIELPPDHLLRADLVGTRKRPTSNGVTVILPRTGDGRHGDYVPALALCLAYPPDPPLPPEPKRDPELDAALTRLRDGSSWDGLASRLLG
jgi:hypothetical protein